MSGMTTISRWDMNTFPSYFTLQSVSTTRGKMIVTSGDFSEIISPNGNLILFKGPSGNIRIIKEGGSGTDLVLPLYDASS